MPLYSHQRDERERRRESGVIGGEREEEGVRAVRWLPGLDSQVDCI